ncbi:MAG: hypothetical protein ABIH08_01690 [Candidatus Omnitrophota bacterium]
MGRKNSTKNKNRGFELICLGIGLCVLSGLGILTLRGNTTPPQPAIKLNPPEKAAIYDLPQPGQLLPLSKNYSYPVLKGIKIDPKDPFKLEFIVDTQNEKDASKEELSTLIKYFLAGLTIPEKYLWVNLSPYEKNKVIPEKLGLTELGKNLLCQDYMLKQLVSSLIYPESPTGKKYWNKTYQKVHQLASTTNIPIETFNKVWIVPERAEVYENKDVALITDTKLKVLSEQDYLALEKNISQERQLKRDLTTQVNKASQEILKETILPEIERDVNEGENFAQLRQIYHSLILGVWFKKKLKDSIYQYYIGQGKIEGVDLENKNVKEKIYNLYVESFKKRVYDFIKTEYEPSLRRKIKRRYYSGGIEFARYFEGIDTVIKYTSSSAIGTNAFKNSERLKNAKVQVKTISHNQASSGVEGEKQGVNLNNIAAGEIPIGTEIHQIGVSEFVLVSPDVIKTLNFINVEALKRSGVSEDKTVGKVGYIERSWYGWGKKINVKGRIIYYIDAIRLSPLLYKGRGSPNHAAQVFEDPEAREKYFNLSDKEFFIKGHTHTKKWAYAEFLGMTDVSGAYIDFVLGQPQNITNKDGELIKISPFHIGLYAIIGVSKDQPSIRFYSKKVIADGVHKMFKDFVGEIKHEDAYGDKLTPKIHALFELGNKWNEDMSIVKKYVESSKEVDSFKQNTSDDSKAKPAGAVSLPAKSDKETITFPDDVHTENEEYLHPILQWPLLKTENPDSDVKEELENIEALALYIRALGEQEIDEEGNIVITEPGRIEQMIKLDIYGRQHINDYQHGGMKLKMRLEHFIEDKGLTTKFGILKLEQATALVENKVRGLLSNKTTNIKKIQVMQWLGNGNVLVNLDESDKKRRILVYLGPVRDFTPESYSYAFIPLDVNGKVTSSKPITISPSEASTLKYSLRKITPLAASSPSTKGGIALKNINPQISASSSLRFNLPPETIQKFQNSSGLTFEIIKIEQEVDVNRTLGIGKR